MDIKGQKVVLDPFAQEPYIRTLDFSDTYLIRRPKNDDLRGSFQELWRLPILQETLNNDLSIKQSQISSSRPGVIRGFHSEPQTKLMTPVSGKIAIVLLDLRANSPTLHHWMMLEFDNETSEIPIFYTLIVPPGVANSLCIFGNQIGMNLYGMTELGKLNATGMGISIFDPQLKNIPWPVDPTKAILSERDKNLPFII